MSNDTSLTALGSQIVSGLAEFCEALESGDAVESRFTVRTVVLDLKPRAYSAEEVKHLRGHLKASQTIFARFLGVSVKTVRAWEQGLRNVPPIAARFMDELAANPDLWTRRLTGAASTREVGPS